MTNTLPCKKGHVSVPKPYRNGLDSYASSLCESITSVLKLHQLTPADFLETLPKARECVFARRYPELAGPMSH